MVLGAGIGIGLKLPGIGGASAGVSVGGGVRLGGGIHIGGGIGIGGGCVEKHSKWDKVPSDCSSIQDLGRFAVEEYNRKNGNNLEFKIVYEAAIVKLDPYISHYLLSLKAIDCLLRVLKFKAVVIEIKKLDGKPELKLEAFEQIID